MFEKKKKWANTLVNKLEIVNCKVQLENKTNREHKWIL